MEAEVPFSEAQRVFAEVQRRIEDAVEAHSPGAHDITMSFSFMAGTHGSRRVVVLYRNADGGEHSANFWLLTDGLAAWQWSGELSSAMGLNTAEEKIFTDLVCLGACLGFWDVLGLIHASMEPGPSRSVFAGPLGPTPVTPLALMIAFEGGTLEEEWPNRGKHVEGAWFRWQAKHAAVQAEHERPTPYSLERSVWDEPEYLRG